MFLLTVPRRMKAFDKQKSYKSRQFGVHGFRGAACECDKTVTLYLPVLILYCILQETRMLYHILVKAKQV